MHYRLLLSFILANCILAGGASAQRIDCDGSWGDPGFNLLSQSAEGVELVYSLPSIRFGKHAVNGRTFDTVAFPGVALPKTRAPPICPLRGVSSPFRKAPRTAWTSLRAGRGPLPTSTSSPPRRSD